MCGLFGASEITWGGGTVRQRKQASIHRKDVPCGRYDLAGPGLYSQRELAYVLFFDRVLF